MIDKIIPPAYAFDLSTEYGYGYIPSIGDAFSKIVGPGFAIAAVALVLYILIAAFRYITSGGDKEAVAGARAMIVHSIIGFLLLMMLFIVLKFLPEALNLGIKFIP